MAENSKQRDKVTKLDKPVLSLKMSSETDVKRRKTPVPNRPIRRKNKTAADKFSLTKADQSPSNAKIGKKNHRCVPSKKKSARTPALQSRQIVFDILVDVENGGQLDKALAAHTELPKLDGRDRRFVQLLATTYLRRHGQLKKILAPLVTRRPFGSQGPANIILAMGAAQLLFLKTGAHAAVDSTVELMRLNDFERLCGLANAVMRRLTRHGEELLENTHHEENLPQWLRLSWQNYWGDTATNEIGKLAMLPPPLDISVAKNAELWAQKLNGKLLYGNTIRREFDGDPAKLDGFAEGAWWVQDAAAAMPARLLTQLRDKQVIDLCAAPGGKTAQLIAAGADVTAIDSSRKRLDRLRRNLKRLKMPTKLVLSDGRAYVPDTPVDAILLDAPCSSTGTVRRRPDIFGRHSNADISSLQTTQWELATTALGWLKPNGQMVYATCSLQPEEGEDVIAAILEEANGHYKIAPITSSETGIFAQSITSNGCLRILPSDYSDIGGVDGFFIARLVSVA